ncbi:hypothetical protein [Micromonospora sp. NBC_01638]|uniref:hypothetical protein n=1 Tax=Micromonospora sp. NBC_01638 TaxID=2975982 RepID=UPI003866403B|nr:hypothetical protein OG811_31650 [Micromonospora sp. NBC_01638]
MPTTKRVLASAVAGIALATGAVATPAAADVHAMAGCTPYSVRLAFADGTPWHSSYYGSSPVLYRSGGAWNLTHKCKNDHLNVWYRNVAGEYAWDNYLA